MNIAQIEAHLQQLLANLHPQTFIYDLLLAYGTPKSSIVRLQQGGLNLSKNEGEIAWKKKLFYKTVAPEQDVHEVIERLKADDAVAKYDPRFIVVTDFETLLALDRKKKPIRSMCPCATWPNTSISFCPRLAWKKPPSFPTIKSRNWRSRCIRFWMIGSIIEKCPLACAKPTASTIRP